MAAVRRSSAQSLYRRFFGLKRHFSEQEIAFFLNVDFVSHVALVAMIDEGGRPVIIGGGRYIVEQPGKAEIAFAVVDEYQGQGIGAALMRHLAGIAREAGLKELTAEVLPDNISMLRVFEKSGLRLRPCRQLSQKSTQIRATAARKVLASLSVARKMPPTFSPHATRAELYAAGEHHGGGLGRHTGDPNSRPGVRRRPPRQFSRFRYAGTPDRIRHPRP